MKKSLLRFCELSTFRVTKSFLRGRVSDSSGIVFHFFFLSCSHDLYTAPWPYIYNLYNIVCTHCASSQRRRRQISTSKDKTKTNRARKAHGTAFELGGEVIHAYTFCRPQNGREIDCLLFSFVRLPSVRNVD